MDTINSSNDAGTNEFIKKYSSYFFEIKRRLFLTFSVSLLGAIVGFVFYENIIKFMIDLLSLKGVNIVFTSPFQFINLATSCGLATGLIIVFPVIIYQILSFLKPALKNKEFSMVIKFIPLCIILFLLGFAFGFLIMKWQIRLFLAKSISLGIGNILDVSSLISTVVIVSVLMGIAFQFPIVTFMMMRFNIIRPKHLAKQRMWFYLGSLLFAILLPPDSVIADFLLALPLIILYELTLILHYIFDAIPKKKQVAAA